MPQVSGTEESSRGEQIANQGAKKKGGELRLKVTKKDL